MRRLLTTLALLTGIFILSSCAREIPIEECTSGDIYGFWGGLWHGFIVPFSFIISLFKDDVAIYAVNNTGTWYDCGFVLGAGILFGGGGSGAKRR